MEKNTKNDTFAQGAKKVPTETEFHKMIENDLKTCISFLAAIQQDPNTVKNLSEFLYGRFLNQHHREELEAQTKVKV